MAGKNSTSARNRSAAAAAARGPARGPVQSTAQQSKEMARSVEAGVAAEQENANARAEHAEKDLARRQEAAVKATEIAEEEGRLPENTAGANPEPGNEMGANGVFLEPAMKQAVENAADHPSVENNPRKATSAVQNGMDFNDPTGRNPADPKFAGQGLDLSVYGAAATGGKNQAERRKAKAKK